VVSDLPTDDDPGGRWWPDVGPGAGFWEPIPLLVGEYDDGPFRNARDLTTYDAWHRALLDIGLSLDGFEDDDLRALFDRSLEAHKRWVAAGRP
jgi:hypothetical protein